MINLISNAIKFSDEGSRIEIHTSCDETEYRIQVKDHGIGISKEDQQHLMERFFRGSNATNIQGTGLGLHIVSKYVEKLHGVMSFQSEINNGTTFTIHFKHSKPQQHENNFID